jgi:hypothetical protein
VNQTQEARKRLLRQWVRYVKIACISIAALLTLLFVVGILIGDTFEKWFVQRLNESLTARVEIGEISFSLVRNFPNAGIRLSKVKAYNAKDYAEPGVLLQADQIDFTFSIWGLISGDYAIDKAVLKDAKLQLLQDKDGKTNYNIFGSTDSTGSSQKFEFDIKTIKIENTEFFLNDYSVDFVLATRIESCTFSGEFNSDTYQMQAIGDIFVHDVKTKNQSWLKAKALYVDLNTIIDKRQSEYSFSDCSIELGRLKISFNGKYLDQDAPYLDFSAAGVDMNIRSLLSLMPPGYEHYVDRYESVGNLSATLRLKGKLDGKTNPALRIEFASENLSVENTLENISLEKINCKGRFENRPGGYLRFDAFEGNLNSGSIRGKCEISNFSRPRFSFDMNASINLADIQRFVEIKPLYQLSGDASIQLKMDANTTQVEQFAAGGYKTMQANGNIRINNASFRIDGDTLPYTAFSGKFNFDGNTVNVSEFIGKAGQTDFKLHGKLTNLFGWLFGEQESIGITAAIESQQVKLDELFSRKSVQKSGQEENYTFHISQRLNLDLSARVSTLTFQRFKANAISGNIRVAGATLSANSLVFRTMNGSVGLNGTVTPASNNNLVIQCDATLHNVDIRQLFYECENFGQAVLEDKNLRGSLDATVQFSALADAGLKIDDAKVISKADLIIKRGELIAFEPLEPLSKYIALEELRHVKFSELKNTIEIRNQKIYIPMMNIESSAMSLSASGIHSFDNEIEYHIKLLLSELLSRKAKSARREVEEFGEVEDDGSGKTSLFIAMKGRLDNPTITFDGKGAREKIKNDIQREKQNMKQILHEEWGMFKRDTTLKKPKENENSKKKNKVIIDFDEEDD